MTVALLTKSSRAKNYALPAGTTGICPNSSIIRHLCHWGHFSDTVHISTMVSDVTGLYDNMHVRGVTHQTTRMEGKNVAVRMQTYMYMCAKFKDFFLQALQLAL